LKPLYSVNPVHATRRADRAAPAFDTAGFVHALTRQGLLERLEPIRIDASRVADLGCGTGGNLAALEKRFRRATVIGLDRSQAMLELARRSRRWPRRPACLRCDPAALPLAARSIDVLFSNLALAGTDDPAAVAAEAARVLRADGLFAFVTLGPDSLDVLRHAWQRVDDDAHVQRFPDMHDLGDILVRAGLRDPVVDVDRVTLEYASTAALFRDLTSTGARNSLVERRRTLTAPGRFRQMTAALEAAAGNGPLEVTLELVYGHCWGSGQPPRDGVVRIAADAIPLRRG
jgi:malonyl-CoA O-methyltransferase